METKVIGIDSAINSSLEESCTEFVNDLFLTSAEIGGFKEQVKTFSKCSLKSIYSLWRKVENCLPELNVDVLVMDNEGTYAVMHRMEGKYWEDKGYSYGWTDCIDEIHVFPDVIVAWMPIPKFL